MFGPHDVVPPSLLSSLGEAKASVLCIYYSGDTANIQIVGSDLILTDGATVHTISMVGKSSSEVAGEITKSTTTYSARVLLDVDNLSTLTPSASPTDKSADGGYLIRVVGHVVKSLEETSFRLLPPYPEGRRMPWYPLVEYGVVKKRFNGADWIFSIPEYDKQAWSRLFGKPYMDVVRAPVERPSPRTIKLPRKNVLWRKNNFFLYVNNQRQSPSVVSDLDEYNGLVYLKTTYEDDEDVRASFTYKEPNHSYRGIDLNPTELHNPSILGRYVVVYLLPFSGPGGVVRGNTIRHQEGHSLLGAVMSVPRTDEPVMILGAYHVSSPFTPDNITAVDTRTKGGGIKKDRKKDAIARNDEVWSATDIGHYDGLPYPGNSAIVMSLDSSVKDAIKEAELMGRIKKHVALGTYIFVEYR